MKMMVVMMVMMKMMVVVNEVEVTLVLGGFRIDCFMINFGSTNSMIRRLGFHDRIIVGLLGHVNDEMMGFVFGIGAKAQTLKTLF